MAMAPSARESECGQGYKFTLILSFLAKKTRPYHSYTKYQPKWSLKYQGFYMCILRIVQCGYVYCQRGVPQIKRHCANKRHNDHGSSLSDTRMLSDQV